MTVACEADGTPILPLSSLARHKGNLQADARACLLLDGTSALADPLQGGRLSVFGRVEAANDAARARFIARHPHAAAYAGFADFRFYRLVVEGAHYVGGFGRIHKLAPRELLISIKDATPLLAAEIECVAHFNAEHGEAVELCATRLLGAQHGPWRVAGCDPEGCDLVLGTRALRMEFITRVTTPDSARHALAELVQAARAAADSFA